MKWNNFINKTGKCSKLQLKTNKKQKQPQNVDKKII